MTKIIKSKKRASIGLSVQGWATQQVSIATSLTVSLPPFQFSIPRCRCPLERFQFHPAACVSAHVRCMQKNVYKRIAMMMLTTNLGEESTTIGDHRIRITQFCYKTDTTRKQACRHLLISALNTSNGVK